MPNRRRGRSFRRSRSTARAWIEHLERRRLLDTGARPAFAEFQGDISTPSAFDSIPVQIGASNFASVGHKALLIFTLQSTGSSSLKPAAIQLETASRKPVRSLVSQTASAHRSESFLLAAVAPGTYTILVPHTAWLLRRISTERLTRR